MSKEKELILEAKHVTKKFPLTKGKELIANDDVSLKFYKGQTLGIVGESGCGKSTFMRMMVQLEQPTSGEILFGRLLHRAHRHQQQLHQGERALVGHTAHRDYQDGTHRRVDSPACPRERAGHGGWSDGGKRRGTPY